MKTRKRVLSIFLTLALTVGLLAIAPVTAHAAPASIDVSTLIDGGGDIYSPLGDDTWSYNDTTKLLMLTLAGGSYTLTGTNTNLGVQAAAIENVTLNGVDIDGPNSSTALDLIRSTTVTLIGGNILSATASSNPPLQLGSDESFTINGSGSLTASGSGMSRGIQLSPSSNLCITGTASVTAVGGTSFGLGVGSGSSVSIGDTAKLTITNNNSSLVETHTFGKAGTATTHKWKLTGADLASGYELTDDEIEVTVAPGATATIEREPIVAPTPDKGIFCTNARWYGEWWHYVLFFLVFGFLWMWF